VEEIIAAGGTAVADAHSVEDGGKVVQTAINAFGRLDIIINNAGIAFPKSFEKVTQDEWDRMVRVHLTGSFSVTQAAWGHFKAQRYGRVVMTSSPGEWVSSRRASLTLSCSYSRTVRHARGFSLLCSQDGRYVRIR
jgi:NAD(P)-dependent dehydrogenase (short-subunit alcohol dehydrogenase family)